MANKGKTVAQQAYKKELKRVKQLIRRAEQRGYTFESNPLPKVPKRITEASVRKLEKITHKTLYKKAELTNPEQYEAYKEKVRQQKFEYQRRKKDREEQERLRNNQEFADKFSEGQIVYNRILEMIDGVSRDHVKAGEHLRSVLDSEIGQYGKDKVFRALADAPQEAVELSEIALRYNPGDPRHDDAIRELLMLITGTIPTAEESRNLQDAIDSDTYME